VGEYLLAEKKIQSETAWRNGLFEICSHHLMFCIKATLTGKLELPETWSVTKAMISESSDTKDRKSLKQAPIIVKCFDIISSDVHSLIYFPGHIALQEVFDMAFSDLPLRLSKA
jgi:hypothetical protein